MSVPAGLCPLKTGDWQLISLQYYLTGVFPALIKPCHLHRIYDRVKNLIKLYNYLNAAEKFTAADYIKGLIEKFDTLSGLYGNFKRLYEVLSVNSVGCGKKF